MKMKTATVKLTSWELLALEKALDLLVKQAPHYNQPQLAELIAKIQNSTTDVWLEPRKQRV